MKRSLLLLSLFLLLAGMLAGCKTASAEEILQNALRKIDGNKTSSFSYTLTVDESASQYLYSIQGEGYQEGNERIYLELSSPETANETIEMVLVKPERTIYSRMGQSTQWAMEPASDNGTIYFTFTLWLLETQTDTQPLFQNPKLLGIVEKDGSKCYHVQFDLDSRLFFETLAPGQLEEWGDLTFKTTKADVYISKATNNLVRAEFSVAWYGATEEESTSIACDIAFTDFNKAVSFPDY